MMFNEVAPRVWVPTEEPVLGFHLAGSVDDLRTIVVTQALYDGFPAYRAAFDLYNTFNPELDDPTIPDFFSRFQFNLMTAVQACDDLGALTDLHSEKFLLGFPAVKRVDLDRLVKNASGRLNFDQSTTTFLTNVVQGLTKVDRTTCLGHVNGSSRYSRIGNLYSGLSNLDQYLDEPFFAVVAADPKHTTLQQYNAALFKRLQGRGSGLQRKGDPLKTTSTAFTLEERARIEKLAVELSEEFPDICIPSSITGGGSRSSGVSLSGSSGEIRLPYLGKKSNLLDDYSIMNFLFYSITGEYLAHKGIRASSELDEDLLNAFVLGREISQLDLVSAFQSGDIDREVGLEPGTLGKVSSTLGRLYNYLPKEARDYLSLRTGYELDFLKKQLECPRESGRLRKERNGKLKQLGRTLPSLGYELSHIQLIERVSAVENLIPGPENRRMSRWGEALQNFGNIGKFFTSETVQSCLAQYKIGIPDAKYTSYFFGTVNLHKA